MSKPKEIIGHWYYPTVNGYIPEEEVTPEQKAAQGQKILLCMGQVLAGD